MRGLPRPIPFGTRVCASGLPKSYFQKLSAAGAGVMARGSAQRRSLMAGEYWLGTTIMARHNWIAKKAGVKMDPIYPKEGVVALPIGSVIMAKAKNPNMAKLFVDYWRSVEGTSHAPEL